MKGRFLLTAAVAVLGLAGAGNVALAQEFQRLTYTPDQPIPASGVSAGVATMTLQINEDTEEAENVLTWGRRGWGWGGRGWGWGGRSWGWAGHRGWGWGGWGARSWGWGGWGVRSWGWSGPRVWGWAGSPGWGWGGSPVFWSGPPVYYYSAPSCYSYYYPIATDVDSISAPNYTQAITSAPNQGQAITRVDPTRVYGGPNGSVVQVAPPAAPQINNSYYPQNNGTYYYDGGPRNPVPLPKSGVETRPVPQLPSAPPKKTVPLEGLPVSLPANSPAKFAYPAYGEKPVQTNFAEDRVIAVKK